MVVDASVWVAALLANDARHPEAAGFLNKLVTDGAEVSAPLLALSEVAGAIARQTGNPAVAEKAVAFLREQTWIQLAPLNEALATLAASIAAYQQLRNNSCAVPMRSMWRWRRREMQHSSLSTVRCWNAPPTR